MASLRGGQRTGSGRKKLEDKGKTVRMRMSEVEHRRWTELKTLKKLSSDNAVAKYLLDLAADLDEQGPSRLVACCMSRLLCMWAWLLGK